jgi:hypothetical protein
MSFRGVTVDVPVRDLEQARLFYEWWHGRQADLMPNPAVLEWILHAEPQVAFRVMLDPDRAGTARVGVGVDDVEQERARLAETRTAFAAQITRIPGVIALLELEDDDGNNVVYWEDLLPQAATSAGS